MRPSLSTLVCVLGILFSPETGWSQAGQSGLAFLKLGVGARAAGMGEAYTAVSTDATTLFWNPSRMIVTDGRDITFVHTQWLQSVTHEFIGGLYSNGNSAVGLSLSIMSVNDIERRGAIPTASPIATFSAHDVAFSASYARKLNESWGLGLSAKAVTEKILFDSASGVAFDLGVHFVTAYDGLTLGGVIRNIGPDLSFIQEKFPLPREIRIGASFIPATASLGGNVMLSADLSKYRGESLRLHMGGEYTYQDRIAAAAGYRFRRDEAGLSAGLGIRLPRYQMDYAFVPYGAGLGTTHRFALGYRF